MDIEISPKIVLKKLLYLICTLLFLNIAGIIFKFCFHHSNVYGLIPLFDFDHEANIPTLYSSLTLLVSSALLFIIGTHYKRKGSDYLYWFGLALIFLFLSIDEISSIHEKIGAHFHDTLNTSGLFYFAWIIPYGIGLLAFLIAYLKFLVKLPMRIMILFFVSGAVFVSGAIGLESIGGRYAELHGPNNLAFALCYTCEEFLEMLGIAVFIYTLLTFITTQFNSLTIKVKDW